MNKVTHLHFHSEYSLLDSLIQIKKIPEIVKKVPTKAIALTDHGNVDGIIKFYQILKEKTDVIPLLGCEFYVVDDLAKRESRKRYHMVTIAKNREGFSSIMRALTVANVEGFYYKPRIDWNYMLQNMDNIVVMTACIDGLFSHSNCGDLFWKLMEKYKDDFYVEIMLLTDFPGQKERNEEIREVSDKQGVELAITTDVHYEEKDDWMAREVCFAINYHRRLDPNMKFDPNKSTREIYFKNYDQMVEGLRIYGMEDHEGKMVKVWNEITEKCTFDLEQMSVTVPIAYEEAKENPEEYMKEICRKALEERRQKEEFLDEEEALQRMEHELKEICELGFAEYFLLVRDMVLKAQEKGIMVGVGRGSVGGSLVAYLMGITGVNPLDYELVFERFISPGRHDLPDIDLDFEDVKRDLVLKYLKEKYEEKSVAQVATYAQMKGRGAIRDVSRVFSVPLVEVDSVAKKILVRSGGDARASFTIEDTVSLFEKAREFNKKYPYVIKVAKKLEGLLKNKGVHAAGIVVDTTDLGTGEKCVLMKAKTGEAVVNWDKKDLEYMGLMKIDVLGLKTLNVLHEIQDLVKKRKGIDFKWEEIKFDDPKVFDRFRVGDTIGCFQFGSAGMIQYLRDFTPENFQELYQANALYRPGTLRSGLANKFIRYKKKDIDPPKYLNDDLKKILEETYGIVLFQEQIMYILNRIGNIPWRTADVIRKVVSKSEGQEKFESFRKQFLKGVAELKSMPDGDADKIFSLMKFFGSYGFNKSHSVEYTILGYWTMWAKVYYPLEFFCVNLRRAGDKDDISNLLTDVNRANIEVELPNVNKSEATWAVEDDKILRAGFDIIKGISAKLAQEIVRTREEVGGEFKSFKHFINSVNRRLVNIARIRVLLAAGAFEGILIKEEARFLFSYIETFKRCPESMEEALRHKDEVEEIEIDLEEIFNFELTGSYFEFNKKLLNIVKGGFALEKLVLMRSVLDSGTLPEHWYIGKFDEIKYGYRTAVTKRKDYEKKAFVDSRGYADDLGGIYGIFRDDSYLCYATIPKKLYYKEELKGRIEDMAGKYVLVRADKPMKSSNLFINEMYFMDDIKEGDFTKNLQFPGIIKPAKQTKDREEVFNGILDCSECSQRQSCKEPVPFSQGEFDVMIVGEAPGKEEDEQGIPFIGKAGQIFWSVMKEFQGKREWFYISNIQKCRPENNELDEPTAFKCADIWIQKEIEAIKPKLIFSLGSPAYRYFSKEKKGGVLAKSGTGVWSEKHNMWILYSIHPAYTLYDASRMEGLKDTVKKFMNMFTRLL